MTATRRALALQPLRRVLMAGLPTPADDELAQNEDNGSWGTGRSAQTTLSVRDLQAQP